MGRPKFSRKKYETPSHPWQEERIKAENELVKKYGLKNKREIWKAETRLKKYRQQARGLLAKVGTGDVQSKKESEQLLLHLDRMKILPPNSTLDDVLALETEAILSRRLQTIAYLKGLSNTPNQARQLIAHGHVAVGNKRLTIPGYMVSKEEESEIAYIGDSALNDPMHPARPRGEFSSIPIKRDAKPKEEKVEETKPAKDTQPPAVEEKPVESSDTKPVEEQKAEGTPVKEPSTEEPSAEPPVEEKPEEPPIEEKPEKATAEPVEEPKEGKKEEKKEEDN